MRDDLIRQSWQYDTWSWNTGEETGNLNLVEHNIEQHTNLSQNMEKLNDVIKNTVHTGNITLEKAKIDRLAQGVGNLPKLTELSNSLESLRTEVTKSATLEVVQKQVVVMATLLSDVNTTSNKMDHKIDDFDFKKGW